MIKSESIALAALLHDIGKFAQLGGTIPSEDEKRLMAEFNLQNGSSHSHTIHSSTFIEHHFKNGKEDVSQLVLYHHFPEKAPEAIRIDAMRLALADWLSNGNYRGNEQIISDEAYTRPLTSIFSKIYKEKNNSPNRYVKPSVLGLNLTDLFPKPISEINSNSIKEELRNLWKRFNSEFQTIDLSKDFEKYFLTILNLLEKFTITIPAVSEEPEQDITLYHHLKTTTAIATCLVNLTDDEIKQAYAAIKENKLSNKMLAEPSFYLVGGDISGIQQFIYSVTSEHALKGLRGRSFYLQLISEAVAKSILDKFELTAANVLYIGGGHFFLLLPKKETMVDELNEIIGIVDHNLLEAHHGKLALVIGKKELSFMDFLGSGFGKVFHLLKKELSIAKRRKFASLLKNKTDFQRIMKSDVGGEQEVCEICSDELTDKEQKIAKQKGTHQCRFCESYINLANDLAYKKILIEEKMPKNFKKFQGEFGSYYEVLEHLGFHFEFSDKKKEQGSNLKINSTQFLGNSESYDGFRFFPKYAPFIYDPIERRNRVKNLEDFSKRAKGLTT
ncbi:MAG: type III-A CRISPR-associated protein Cas10/Csm1, partial [candidate division KSB1 bacterium]|nr:type III-A CRISPR-associated protein Cas10/Csm1 [candidate division KSB1 bacterium]